MNEAVTFAPLWLSHLCDYLVTGGNWPNTVALWMIDSLTWTGCTGTDGECISSAEVSWCRLPTVVHCTV